jgi:hypothetical protein
MARQKSIQNVPTCIAICNQQLILSLATPYKYSIFSALQDQAAKSCPSMWFCANN